MLVLVTGGRGYVGSHAIAALVGRGTESAPWRGRPRGFPQRSRRSGVDEASGGSLPPLLAAGRLLAARDHSVWVLASAATREQAVEAGFELVSYRRARDPNMELAFEQQTSRLMAIAAGSEVASTCARSRQKCGPS
jgi:hypothetical protein